MNICKDELYKKYIIENLSKKDTAKYFNTNPNTLRHYLDKYNIKKTKEQRLELTKKGYIEKYGVDNPMKLDSIKEKIKKTNIERYGADNVFSNKSMLREDINNKIKNQLPETLNKIQETNLERYGCISPFGNSKVKERIKEVNRKRYGVDYYMSSTKLNLSKEYIINIIETFKKKPTLYELADKLGIGYTTTSRLILNYSLSNYINKYNSYLEIKFKELLDSLNIHYIEHNRTLIKPYELDFFLPDYNIAFEVNDFGTHINKDEYHKSKLNLCKQEGITLYFIWENVISSPRLYNELKEDIKDILLIGDDYMKEIILNYYIVENHTRKETADYINVSENELRTLLRKYNIVKPRSLSTKNISYDKEEAVNKRKKTCIEKYGVDNPAKADIVKEKYSSTISNREDITKETLKELYIDKQLTIEDISKELNSTVNHIAYLVGKYNITKTRKEIAESLSKKYQSKYSYIEPSLDYKEYTNSDLESIVEDFIKTLGVDYKKHARDIIDKLEIDFYLPEYKLGIEVNDIASHNSTVGYLGSDPKPRTYHKNKTLKAIENNIHLITIYEWELLDKDKFNIIKNYIKKIVKGSNTIYARNCIIKEVGISELRSFLDNNHLQGWTKSSINLGLYYNDTLVEVMTFGKSRFNSNFSWELIRLCSLSDYNIIGGASKLFKFFIDTYKPSDIISYCDIDKFSGSVYNKLGFEFIEYSEPSYIYTDYKNIIPRYKAQKSKLPKLFNMEFDNNLSESEIMESLGYVKVYNSGNAVYKCHFL